MTTIEIIKTAFKELMSGEVSVVKEEGGVKIVTAKMLKHNSVIMVLTTASSDDYAMVAIELFDEASAGSILNGPGFMKMDTETRDGSSGIFVGGVSGEQYHHIRLLSEKFFASTDLMAKVAEIANRDMK